VAKTSAGNERVKLWRLPELGKVDLLRATYVTQTFPRHTHEGFAVGVIEHGALGFFYRGENVVAPAGFINLANPGEPHTGHAAVETGWTYRMFYLDVDVLQKAAHQMSGRLQDLPFFRVGVIYDERLAGLILNLHRILEKGDASLLEKESGFLRMLAGLIARHADAPPLLRSTGRERLRIRRVREYIEEHFSEDIPLSMAASIACLSPFHFLRVFSEETGLTPHAYLTQVRVRRAKALIEKGWQVAAAACEVGFTDQSHLTRHFKRITGITPGYFSKIVQDG
jgi:AraC-like DNA-binding protein